MSDARLVYSTRTGRICPECSQIQAKCSCKKRKTQIETTRQKDGIIRIQREVKGRRGKTVTTICGLETSGVELKKIASELKNRCGTGGSVKNGTIIIQGDHKEILLSELKKRGFRAKLSGG